MPFMIQFWCLPGLVKFIVCFNMKLPTIAFLPIKKQFHLYPFISILVLHRLKNSDMQELLYLGSMVLSRTLLRNQEAITIQRIHKGATAVLARKIRNSFFNFFMVTKKYVPLLATTAPCECFLNAWGRKVCVIPFQIIPYLFKNT